MNRKRAVMASVPFLVFGFVLATLQLSAPVTYITAFAFMFVTFPFLLPWVHGITWSELKEGYRQKRSEEKGAPSLMKEYMIAKFDVTELNQQERDLLAGEVSVQAECTDADSYTKDGKEVYVPGKPDVPYPDITWVEEEVIQ